MVEIDLGEGIKFEVKYRGETYQLREPTVSEVDYFRQAAEGDPGKSAGIISEFLSTLGMPKEVVESIGMATLKRLIDGIVGELDKKK